jgi:outer membrane protein OmpA-like peptidoglycan-associated protein
MNKYLKNMYFIFSAGILLTGVAACAPLPDEEKPVLQATVPQTNAQKQKVYTYLLKEQGIRMIEIGETRNIVIDSRRLFVADSANFDESYAGNLRVIAQLLNTYDTTHISVNVYTDQSGEVGQALTEKQAQKILELLQKYGAETRLFYAKGYGNLYPVVLDKKNSTANRRIEIKFQFEQPERVY